MKVQIKFIDRHWNNATRGWGEYKVENLDNVKSAYVIGGAYICEYNATTNNNISKLIYPLHRILCIRELSG